MAAVCVFLQLGIERQRELESVSELAIATSVFLGQHHGFFGGVLEFLFMEYEDPKRGESHKMEATRLCHPLSPYPRHHSTFNISSFQHPIENIKKKKKIPF